jgi:hypothetical protein
MSEAISTVPAYRRRLLLVDTGAEYTRMQMNMQTRRVLTTPTLRFVDLDEALVSTDPILQSLCAKGLLQAGTLLIQSLTVPDQYTRLSGIGDQTAEAKVAATVRICQLLGARRVEIQHAEFKSNERTSGKSGDVRVIGVVKTSGNSAFNTVEVGGLRLKAAWTFQGDKPKVEEASRALAASGLQDESLSGMIDFFRTSNWPTGYAFEISTTEEMRRIREFVSDVSVPAAFKGHTELESLKMSESSYEFQLRVEFPTAS